MPFASYRDFADCVRRNADKRDPQAYCAVIERAVQTGKVRKSRKLYVKQHPHARGFYFSRDH